MNSEYEKYLKELKDMFHQLASRYGKQEIFHDFVKMCAIAIYNPIVKNEEIEKDYLTTINKYKKDEQALFPKMFAKLILMYQYSNEIRDILGEFYEHENLSDKVLQQFFTPMHIAGFMAEISADTGEEFRDLIKRDGYIKMIEPTCGSGVMILGLLKALKKRGINYQEDVLIYANDIDITCTYMTYIQLSLYGISAIVSCGNTLTGEERFRMETPLYFRNYFKFRKPKPKSKSVKEIKKIVINENLFKEHTIKGNSQFSLW